LVFPKFILTFLISLFLFVSFSYSEDLINYQFGRGIKFKNCPLRFGGYFAVKYESTDKHEYEFNIEDAAVLIYGDLTEKTRFFLEIGAKELYVKKKELEDEENEDKNDENEVFIKEEKELNIQPKIERLHFDYLYNDYLKIRVGQFITPIGLWNPVHIPPLKWTLIDPVTATKFFPRLTTGIELFGLLPFQNESWEYSLFIQKTKNINETYNNLKTDNFVGGEIKKYLNNINFSFSLGKFKDKQIDKNLKFAGFSFDLMYKKLEIMSEYMYGKEEDTNNKHNDRNSYYLQGVYRVFPKNYLILRKEYFKEVYDKSKIHAYLIGWNYRPLYPISIKLEMLWKKDYVKNKSEREFATSFSILF
jgi:hypothetical protein